MKYKILVLDLDGTLTNKKKEITAHTRETLIRAQEAGVKIVLNPAPAAEIPARYPVEKAIWRLKPPVTASRSSSSPAKYNPFTSLDSIVLGE